MKFLLTIALLLPLTLLGQGTFSRVYDIMQLHCVSCHNPDSLKGNLDLMGVGATDVARRADVYANLVQVNPSNAGALAKGDKLVYKGRADRSFLFRKLNDGLEPTLSLSANEGDIMTGTYPGMSPTEKELVRQWVLFGAPQTGTVVDEQLIESYYSGNGLESFPAGPPSAPAVGDGFQIKMGPFFLPPGGEIEYYQKYELAMPAEVEVARLDMRMSPYSHHYIVYHFTSVAGANVIPAGLRLNSYHNDIALTAAIQESTDLQLPSGAAFKWPANRILDLNSHVINYSQTMVYKAETYTNVYTQTVGTAAQEMFSTLEANGNIYIPNNSNMDTETATYTYPPINDVFVWGLMGHTHKYGKGYKIFKRTPQGTQGDLLYDGSCPQGTPGCSAPEFDYQHIPLKLYPEFVNINMDYGFVHEAKYLNDGPEPVTFGPTSDDEMMVMIVFYMLDTAGVSGVVSDVTAPMLSSEVSVLPNPVSDYIHLTTPLTTGEFSLFSSTGQCVLKQITRSELTYIATGDLVPSLYIYQWRDAATGRVSTGKVVVQR